MAKDSKELRQRKNRAKKKALAAKKNQTYRRKQGLGQDEEEVYIAPVWRRTIQFCIDQLLLGICALFVFFGFGFFVDSNEWPPIISLAPQVLYGLAYMIPIVSSKGQTIGMKRLGLMVISSDGGGKISLRHSLYRWLVLYLLPQGFVIVVSSGKSIEEQAFIAILGIAMIAIVVIPATFTKNRQGLQDYVSRSVVIMLPTTPKDA